MLFEVVDALFSPVFGLRDLVCKVSPDLLYFWKDFFFSLSEGSPYR